MATETGAAGAIISPLAGMQRAADTHAKALVAGALVPYADRPASTALPANVEADRRTPSRAERVAI